MQPISRRGFLGWSARAAAGAGALALTMRSRPAHAWGALTNPFAPVSVLEIHLYGGLSPWETFYMRAGDRWRWGRPIAPSVSGASACFPGISPDLFSETAPPTRSLGADAAGVEVLLGPVTQPL